MISDSMVKSEPQDINFNSDTVVKIKLLDKFFLAFCFYATMHTYLRVSLITMKIMVCFPFQKFDMDNQKIDTLSNTLVYEYLKRHKKSNIQKLAEKLKALVPIQVQDENPSIEEVINHANISRKILVPVRKKLLKVS